MISLAVVLVTALSFMIFRMGLTLREADRKVAELQRKNAKFKEEIEAQRLSETQVAIVKESAPEMEKSVPFHFKLSYQDLTLYVFCVRSCRSFEESTAD